MNAASLVAGIAPVLLIVALGFAAGKHHEFDTGQAKGFSRLALRYALPVALFLGMAHFDRAVLLEQGPVALVMLLGYGGLFLAFYWGLRRLGMDMLGAALLGYTVSSTAVPIYGLTVLIPIYGEQVGTGVVGLAALITNIAQISVAVFLLQRAATEASAADRSASDEYGYSTGDPHGAATATMSATAGVTTAPSVLATIAQSAANPLVWCPVLGAVVALAGLRLSPSVSAALTPLAVSAAGVAIFSSGLVMAGNRMQLTSKVVVLGSLVCLVIQPALFFGMMKVAGVTGPMAQATFVASTMPTGTPSVLFAQQYGRLEAETAGIMLVTTIGMAAVLPASIGLSSLL